MVLQVNYLQKMAGFLVSDNNQIGCGNTITTLQAGAK